MNTTLSIHLEQSKLFTLAMETMSYLLLILIINKISNDYFLDERVVVTGDGRFDSPGHSARYCHYLFVDYVSRAAFSGHESIDSNQE